LFTGFVKVMLLSYRNPGLAAVLVRDFDMLSRVFNIANSYKNDLKQDAESARLRLVKRLDAEPQLVSALRDNEEFLRLLVMEPTLTNKRETLEEIGGWFRR
jgi:hypothetical protein